ncbi:creatininase family protein [Prochlorococcus sp. MIT 1307]|uniref:creatininase family protein n=1 Tax=Prochlorococcus sp. MIT 1307 TaxID=3096219 RepID=UPI002A74CB34|nr:creatininase family protein [Prochlorococcus sp. MIT 1307]
MSKTSQPRRFDYLSWPKAEEAVKRDGSTLVWPFGACEQHGPHLPLATDNLFAEKILTKVLDRLPKDFPIWMLPSQPLGFSPEHSAFPGTFSLSAQLLLNLVMEVGQQASSLGFRRLLFFNAHGGQIGLLQAAARQLKVNCPSMAVLPCFLWSGVEPLKELLPRQEREAGLHAGLGETSLMLSLAPELVGPERPMDGEHLSSEAVATPPSGWSLEGAAPWAWLTEDLSESGVIGDSRASTSSLGEELEKALVEHWLSLLISLMESKWPPVEQLKG